MECNNRKKHANQLLVKIYGALYVFIGANYFLVSDSCFDCYL